MKKKKYIILGILVFVIPLLYLLYMIFVYSMFEGLPGYSYNIEDAKKNGVFIKEYRLRGKTINLSQSESLEVGEIWAERLWDQGSYFNKVHIFPGYYMLNIEIINKDISDLHHLLYKKKFSIMNSEGHLIALKKIGDKQYIASQFFHKVPSDKETFRIIIKKDTTRFWLPDPIVVDSFIVKKTD